MSLAPPPAGAKKIVVAFASSPSGAAVSVDGRISCTSTPCKRSFLEGTHRVEMVKDGYHSHRESVALSSNGQGVTWTLSALQGRLTLDAVDDRTGDALIGDVYVDGVKVGQTPFDGLVAVSAQKIEVLPEGYDRQTVSVTLEEGKAISATAHFQSLERPKASSGTVAIPAGCFQMGSISGVGEGGEHPQHRVCVSSFSMDATLVMQSAYQSVMGSNPSYFSSCGGNCPVEQVDWNQANEYCHRVGRRLPTEAEWEYAARAGMTTKWYWGDDEENIGDYAWFSGNSESTTHPVAQKRSNVWGLYDMAGNVWQLVSDRYGSYSVGDLQDPQGSSSGSYRVSRGGVGTMLLQTCARLVGTAAPLVIAVPMWVSAAYLLELALSAFGWRCANNGICLRPENVIGIMYSI